MKNLKSILIPFLITSILSGCSVSKKASKIPVTGQIEKTWIEQNVYEKGIEGIRIHTKFSINNPDTSKDVILGTISYFFDDKSMPLKDDDGRYCSNRGFVMAKSNIMHYLDSTDSEIPMFMPYNQLDLRQEGTYNLKFTSQLIHLSGNPPQALSKSAPQNFFYLNTRF